MTHEVRWTVLDNGDFSFQTVDVITRGFLSQWTPVLKEFQHVRLTSTIPRLEAVNHGPDHWKNPFVPKQNWFLASVYLTKKISHHLPIRFCIYLPPSTQSWFICFLWFRLKIMRWFIIFTCKTLRFMVPFQWVVFKPPNLGTTSCCLNNSSPVGLPQ